MDRRGLRLEGVPASCVAASGRSLPEHHNSSICVGRLQPDLVLVSNSLKKIGLVEVCRPMDESSDQLATVHARNLRTYGPLMEYLVEEWLVNILPWEVGVRGLLHSASAQKLLDFLSVPRQSWKKIIEEVAMESVKAHFSLHRVRH